MTENPNYKNQLHNGKLDFIQAMRGVAAMMVVMLHILQLQNIPRDSGFYYWLFSGGGAGVPLFFVISGFIMAYSTKGVSPSLRNAVIFLIKRLSRIWPTYAILTVAFWVIVTAADSYLGVKFPYSILDVLKSILFIPLNLDSESAPLLGASVLYPGWSLNYEVYFYALLAFCLMFKRLRWPAFFSLIVITLVVLPIANGATPSFEDHVNYGWNSYLALATSPLIWEFAAGAAIGLLYFSPLKINNKAFAIFLCATSVAIAVWANLSTLSWGFGITGWGWSLILMFFAFAISSKTVTFNVPAWLVWLGNISYSLYLIHPFFIKPVFDILWETNSRPQIRDPSFSLVIVCFSIFFAWLSHKYLEVRLSDFIKSKLLSRVSSDKIIFAQPSQQ